MTEIELLIDFHKNAKRQGPGSSADTLKALNLIGISKNKNLKIADIGCGSGAQTITLAENIDGQITAVDLFPDFLRKLEMKAKAKGLKNRIKTLEKSMDKLDFEQKKLDIIWSEGAIYNMGFEAGIKSWKKFLKPGGYLSVSEITWLTDKRPEEIEKYWNNEYLEIDTASNKFKVLEKNGFTPAGYFYLPQSSWLDNYYNPIEDRFENFLKRHNHSKTAEKIVENEKKEIQIYRKYKEYLSYGFYIAKKVEN
ncbi:Methyltransferase domain-containing protein [Halanaerobium congolense]|jgi:ubiquinone/menaquinone biosynthesis C-methylase UbiE|uniref:Methyltransferase domain-containing protein n=2 Tax=Halanaerobium congolense TaxID=54121 RepID=A0A1G8PCY2_9FIRM|nr:class I SAM-dependent methyltransferase [Halanaerobium congolense]KXS48866.1 MAG: type 11 methyltransferase [Halanaerobium sp. T82-1]SDI90302.1 Methyltransferase domain-containing protein [Halanaerobium congolense]SET58174.1 Methyltransferase domain-containing protein [Halanaerobium congolense]